MGQPSGAIDGLTGQCNGYTIQRRAVSGIDYPKSAVLFDSH